MKRTRIVWLALALTAAGCVEFPYQPDVGPPRKPPPLVPVEPPAVTPDQVNDGNAAQTLNALREELDHAANENTTAPKP